MAIMLTGIDYIMKLGKFIMYETDEELKNRLVYTALGAASMCWSEIPKGIFEAERCKDIGKELILALDAIYRKHGRK